MSVSVLVPFTANGCEWRQRAWEYVRRRYADGHPDWELVVGTCDGEWSKGAALADAFRQASGDVLVLADADSFVDAAELRRSVDVAGEHGWAVPHRMVHRLSAKASESLYAGDSPQATQVVRRPYMGPAGGGVTVVARSAFDLVGGIDPRFRGWGGEDLALGWALRTLVGPGQRMSSPLWALWHPHPAPNRRGSAETEILAGRYRRARGDPAAMAELVAERAR